MLTTCAGAGDPLGTWAGTRGGASIDLVRGGRWATYLHTCIHYIPTYISSVHTYIYVCICACTFIPTPTYIHVYIYMFIYISIDTYIRTYIHVYTWACTRGGASIDRVRGGAMGGARPALGFGNPGKEEGLVLRGLVSPNKNRRVKGVGFRV